MNSNSNPARDFILTGIRKGHGRAALEQPPSIPPSTRVPARSPGTDQAEIALLLEEISKLGGQTRRLPQSGFRDALGELVRGESVRKAALWQTPDVQALGIGEMLGTMGVQLVSPLAGKEALAQCDLGVTGVDCALPETGTLALRISPERPRLVSLLPRVHLALVQPASLRADLVDVFAEMRTEPAYLFITGPSRTADIEMTVTVGVHGPQRLNVWMLE